MNEFKLTSPIEAHELTQNQKLTRVEWCKKYKDFNFNSAVFKDESTFGWEKRKGRDGLKR